MVGDYLEPRMPRYVTSQRKMGNVRNLCLVSRYNISVYVVIKKVSNPALRKKVMCGVVRGIPDYSKHHAASKHPPRLKSGIASDVKIHSLHQRVLGWSGLESTYQKSLVASLDCRRR